MNDDSIPTLAAIVREQTGLSWSRAKQLCIDGRVTVNGRRNADPAARIASGAEIVVDRFAPKLRRGGVLDEAAIVHADRDVVVVNKPAGMLTVADEAGNKDTLADHLRTLLRQIEPRPSRTTAALDDGPLGVVHRLDRDTSGVMIFARTAHAKRALQEQFREHSVERVYHAVAHGDVSATRMDTWLVLDRGDGLRGSWGHFQRTADEPPPEARHAITHIAPVESLRDATLVECRLETGRQHQIRIHLAETGHMIVGETVYMRDHRGPRLPAPRPLLHARRLSFVHPRHGEVLTFEAEPPLDFRKWVAAHRA